MYHSTTVIPAPGDIRADLDGPWTIDFGPDRYSETVSLHVQTRAVLDALQAALDEIRADMDAEAASVDAEVVAS